MSKDEPAQCDTLGCENEPVEGGYCAECTDISPGILANDNVNDNDDDNKKGDEAIGAGDSASDSPTEGGSGDTNSGFKRNESTVRSREAFADTVDWFHSQLHCDITDLELTYVNDDGTERTVETPREWFREVRGWSDATINDKQLGWAAPYRTGLLCCVE